VRDVPPHFIDITADVTRKHFGRAFGYLVGMDFQKTPHMVGIVYKLFRDPADPAAEELAWIVDEVVVENADENDLVDGLEGLDRWLQPVVAQLEVRRVAGDGYRGWVATGDEPSSPVHCCVVADASGWFQDGAHQKGKRSDRALAARKWTFAFKPQKDSDRNPEISERVKVTNTRLKAGGRRRMFSCPHNVRTNKAMREWQNNQTTGAPNKYSDLAHICDAASYVIYRLFGVPKVRQSSGYTGAGRFQRGDLFPR
jgi:hypothetical protein